MFDAHADLDSDVYDCHFTALDVAISVRGRNLEINDNLISHCNIGIQVLWDTWQNYEQREINIVNNRFHSCNRNDYGKNDVVYDPSRVCIQFPDFIPATSSRAFTIRNNFADYCGNFFSGNLFGVLLDGNQCYLSRGAFIDSTCKILDESQPLATLDYDDLFPTTPTANRGILAASGNVGTGTNIYASDYVTIPAGTKYIKLNWTISTRVWGHFFWTSNDEPIRGVLAHSDLMAVPEGAAKIRFTVPTSKAANLVVRMLSETWATTTTEGSYADKPIEIKNNSVCGAITTDYSYGLNIMTKAILLQYYDNCIISNNEFTNGVGDVIVLDTCSNVLIDGNKFVSAPSFCDVYSKDAPQGPPTTYTGAGKNYIKMDDVTGERIKRNIAYAIGENYVQTAVTMDGVAYTADSTNNFEVAPQTPPESTEP